MTADQTNIKVYKGRRWVVRWQPVADGERDDIIGIFDARISSAKMMMFVEMFYKTEKCTPAEMVSYTLNGKSKGPKPNYMRNSENVECAGYIWCGHQGAMMASIVMDVTIVQNLRTGEQTVTWTNIPMPKSYHIINENKSPS